MCGPPQSCSGPEARRGRPARTRRTAWNNAGLRGAHAGAWGARQQRLSPARAAKQKAPLGQRPGPEKFVRGWGRGPRAPPRTMARPSAGRPSATPPLRRAAAQYLVRVLPAARGRRWPARAASHVHVQRAGERAPQRPHPPRQPHGRQAQAQPARQQSHRGAAAASSDHRRAQAQEEEEEPPPPATVVAAGARAIAAKSPVQPPSGPRRGGGRSGRRTAFSRPPRPFPTRNAKDSSSGFHPVHVQMQEGRSPCPMSGDGEAREVEERAYTFSVAPPGLIMAEGWGRLLTGVTGLLTLRRGPAGLPVFPCLSNNYPMGPSTTPLT